MSTDAKAVFLAAVDQPPADRAAYLDKACAGDAALRQRVEALLRAHDQPSDSPRTPAYASQSAPTFETGSIFAGRYKLREVLGEGGMGTVYVADQSEPVQRRVALKVIRTGLDSTRLLARFEQERQALALMDHPNIAKVFDAGVAAGMPYFAMELIKGVPITRYCDEAKLTPRQRLELFIPICQAVQHAHQKGIIHRDLKPSNVLVGLYDGKPVPKVIDFGVAKATGPRLTENSIYTEVGSLVGTLEYMAPEQAELNNLDIDTRADVYALGVILYELLTGSVPFSRKELQAVGFAEMLRTIKEVEPPKPSTKLSSSGSLPAVAASRGLDPRKLTQQLRGELDWIAMKCLEKERSRRYETANQLALEVQRYLADEPVLAGPPSAAYRLRKFVKRNRGAVLSAGLVAAALMAGVAGTTWGLVEARRQRDAAQAERDVAREQKRRTRAALDTMISKDMVERLGSQKELTAGQREFLQKALGYYKEFAAEAVTDEQGRRLVAGSLSNVGYIQSVLGQREDAAAAFRKALPVLKGLAADFPTVPDYRRALALAHNNLGFQHELLGRRLEGVAEYRAALAVHKKLVVDFPAEPECRRDLALSHHNLGSVLKDLGQVAEAEAEYRATKMIYETLAAEFLATPAYRTALADVCDSLGILLTDLGRSTEAEAEFRAALTVLDKQGPDVRATLEARRVRANTHSNLGLLFAGRGELAAAEAEYRAARSILEQVTADFPAMLDYRSGLGAVRNKLGIVLRDRGQFAAAEVEHRADLEIHAKLAADYPTVVDYREELAAAHNNLGLLYNDSGKPVEATAEFQAAIAVSEKLASDFPNVPKYAVALGGNYCNFGGHLFRTGDKAAARDWHTKAVERLAPVVAKAPQHVTAREFLRNAFSGRAVDHMLLNRFAEALADADAALTYDDGSQRLGLRTVRANCLVHLGRVADAAREVGEVAADLAVPAGTLSLCAGILARASATPDNPDAHAHAARAVALLREAIAKGYDNASHLLADADLAALRHRADYAALLWELADGLPLAK